MKTIWKVLLGLVLVVLVVGLCAGAALLLYNIRTSSGITLGFGRMPMMPGPGINGMMPFYRGPRFPGGMFSGTGYSWLGFGLSLFFRLLIPLLVVGLIIALVVALVRRPVNQTAPMVTPAPAPAVYSASGVCSNCGKPLQSDWKVCPYCGEKI